MAAYPEVAAPLRTWLAGKLGVQAVEITELERHAEGFSWQTYTLTASWVDPVSSVRQQAGYAVRREPEDGLLAPYDTRKEYELHRTVVDHSTIPMPAVHWLEMDPSVLGMPFYVMQRVDGIVPVPWRRDDPRVFPDDDARHALGLHFVDVLADIAAIDWKAAGIGDLLGAADDAEDAARGQIERWARCYHDSLLVEEPIIREAIAWLQTNLAVSGRLSLVHADYRLGNFMVRDGRIMAVFDWELAHIGDPVFDVAWAAMPLYRGRDPRVSQLLAPDEFFARYTERTGTPVEPEVFKFWTVFGHLRAGAPYLRATRAFEDGRSDDVRLAAFGHRMLFIVKSLARELGLR